MGQHKPRFTREIAVPGSDDKVAVRINPDDNTKVVFSDPSAGHALTLDAKAAGQLGQALSQAARFAAYNLVTNSEQQED
jgi:protein-disulfide isomerase